MEERSLVGLCSSFFSILTLRKEQHSMPCNLAVSIATCAVSEERLLALLTPEVVQQVVLSYAQQQYTNITARVFVSGEIVRCRLGGFTVTIANGHVSVDTSTGDRAFAEKLATDFTELVRRLAESLFQKQVQQVLQTMTPQPVQAQVVEVNNAGKRQQAALFTLNL
jgi:hypothetical protein